MSLFSIIKRFIAPALPQPPEQYNKQFFDKFNSILRIYFNQIDNLLGQILSATGIVTLGGTNLDAFGRLRVGSPYTLFDSQQRYEADTQFDTSTASGGSTTYLTNESTLQMSVTTTSGSSVVRQSYRVFPYQPGKSLLILATFTMNAGKTGLRQRVGYFNTENGVFFQQNDGVNAFVLRSSSIPTPGTPSDIRTVNQSDWNGDKLDGTGASGITLDVTKTQIFWCDLEWLGVGNVRCGFIIDGAYVVCHTFTNSNIQASVYMTTAILPVRYEITNTAATATASSMKQICSTVMSEGGYEEYSYGHIARRTTAVATIGTTFKPIVAIRLASGRTNAVILPFRIQVLPITSQNYEVALVKNPTLTGASWTAMPDSNNVEYDVTASAITGGTIVQTDYVTSSGSGGTAPLADPSGYNWALQLGTSLTGTSDIYAIQIRTVSGATTGDAVGSLSFWDLT